MVFIFINIFKKQIVGLFTGDQTIINMTADVMTIAFIGTMADLWQGYLSGVIRALAL